MDPQPQLPVFIVGAPLLFSVIVPVLGRIWRHSAFLLALATVAVAAVASALSLELVLRKEPFSYHLGGWAPPVGIEYVIDEVSAFVCVVITSVSFLVLVSTRRWAEREAGDRPGVFYGLVLLLLAGLTGIVVTGDLFNLFVFLEIASLAAYALVFIGGRKAMLAGFRYLIIGSIGGALYLLGVGFIYFATGTLNMIEARELLEGTPSTRAAQVGAVFIFAGLGLKMALVPMHLWLPDAYEHAPSSVNSLIAPVMTKVAAYAMLRMFLSVFPAGFLSGTVPIADALLILGLIGIVFGSVAAAGQSDIRRMLAYSSISQLAFIAVGIGLGSPLALAAALLHVANHAAMKATLFLAAASVRLRVGLQRTHNLAGLGPRMPLTMGAFAIGSVAMIGIPPTAGFFSKWYMAQAGVDEGQWVVVAVVLFSSLLTAVYLFKVLEQVYLRPAKPEPSAHGDDERDASADAAPRPELAMRPVVERAREAPFDVWLPLVVLAAATVVLGVINVVIMDHVLLPGVS
ncbi:MAG: proton-conducting transporter membrane subunit [Chloroflexota bacterium]|nr:proton-conducting transporter membrane subunit [Chloroflexota bacterium]MDE2885823.1 proton-conducting transporter membrane subunit [Chloroflexota bacterium]